MCMRPTPTLVSAPQNKNIQDTSSFNAWRYYEFVCSWTHHREPFYLIFVLKKQKQHIALHNWPVYTGPWHFSPRLKMWLVVASLRLETPSYVHVASQMSCALFGNSFKTLSLLLYFLLLVVSTIKGVGRYVSLLLLKLHTLQCQTFSHQCVFQTCLYQERIVWISRHSDSTKCRIKDMVLL